MEDKSENGDDVFKKLQEQLEKDFSWPLVYMFKFIIPADNQKIARLENLFSAEAVLNQKASEKGNYISITVKEVMLDATAVIHVYKQAAKIEGVISL